MGKEFTVLKEFSTVSATLEELVAVDRIIKDELPSGEFRTEYVSLISDIHKTYQGVVTILDPLTQLLTPEAFSEHFDKVQPWFNASYQPALSAPRVYAEYTYEKYLQFRKLKEVNTKYPPLAAAFTRLHDFIDKWIDNDIWLAMCIDTVLKILNQILTDVAKMKAADEDEAYRYYYSTISGLVPFLNMIIEKVAVLSESLALEQLKETA